MSPHSGAPYSGAPSRPASDPPVRSRVGRISGRGWLRIVAAGWAVLLLAAAAASVRWDEPTVREQRSLAQAVPVVDRATADLIAAAGGSGVVVESTDRRVEKGCRITALRPGAELTSTVTLRIPAVDGADLLDRIAQRLPAAYRAGTRRAPGESTPTLRADAGEFVAIKGVLTEPDTVQLTLRSGCRPTSGGADVGLRTTD